MKFKKIILSALLLGTMCVGGCNTNSGANSGQSGESSETEHTHQWGSPTYVWSADYSICTAERVCAEDATHIESETANSIYTIVSPASCDDEGLGRYIAIFKSSAFENQSQDVAISATGHVWSNPTYVWSADYSTCTAERVCLTNGNHKESETVSSVYDVSIEATCTSNGLGIYTATFANAGFITQTHAEVIYAGHDFEFDSFVWDGFEAQAKYICSKDESHIEYHDAVITSEITTAATCETEGVRTYTAYYDGHTDTKTESISSLGHEYNPISGHCIHDGCDETLAIQGTINYGDGDFAVVNMDARDFAKNEKVIYDLEFNGSASSTNLGIGLYQNTSSGIFKSNCSITVYDEEFNVLDVNIINTGYALYSLEHNFASGEHIYVHITLSGSDFTDVVMRLSSFQYTGLKVVGVTYKTCVEPQINAHIDFDQSGTTGTWLNTALTEERDQSTFKSGEAGSGHSMHHYAASDATSSSPALKEHWYCEKCGCYFLSSDGDEEVAYEDLYDNTIYGSIISTLNISGRGVVITVRVSVDQGEEPITDNDERYKINGSNAGCGKVVYGDNTISDNIAIIGISVNVHIVQFLLRGLAYNDFVALDPQAFFINI